MNLHRSLAPTAVRCRSLQVWGWTVHCSPTVLPERGAGASKCGGGQFHVYVLVVTRVWCRSLQVWGWTVPASTRICSGLWCRSLQVWGWTVPSRRHD